MIRLRKFETRLNEHRKDVEKVKDTKYTRAKRLESVSDQHKSAITDHVAQENHVINWEGASIIDKDTNKQTRWIREALWIRKRGTETINRDEGIYSLNHMYDPLLRTVHPRNEKFRGSVGGSTHY